MNFVIVSEKSWNRELPGRLQNRFPGYSFYLIDKKEDFSAEKLASLNPRYVFIPHWSYFIPSDIFSQYECVVFHMTDLPYGRGGSPLQNLIIRGVKKTMISALKVVEELDAGPVYLKRELLLCGTAEEIFIEANRVIEQMIIEMIEKQPEPKEQQGEVVKFSRRKPEQSNIENVENIEKLLDHIRMLDAEGYPKAFLETENFIFEFSRASLKSDKTILADVRIISKN